MKCANCGTSAATRSYALCDICYFDPVVHRRHRLGSVLPMKMTTVSAAQDNIDCPRADTINITLASDVPVGQPPLSATPSASRNWYYEIWYGTSQLQEVIRQ